ncbi:penicillin-binding protein 1A [Tunturiibacter gelidoferens]|uniref:Penicillin-binding protein 1A n=1 Tax=Tunturiibacter gelidiferens TaxID=3069689 RepID=A0ACC5P4V3_9BACT|nr:PBP1A family penicillin-binding protein [Edaphobacter lichenicola]MBB5341818.1 penicillin-binding protein 1A [Edaphobacter lichenicola]
MPDWQRALRRATLNGPDYPSRRIARRVTFYALLGLSAVFGALCGLMLVYSIDLPQMDDLARYRPNTTTELLDVHGKPFGSFALERRVVLPYSEFPDVLKQAIISIEDKSFESNWGVNLVRAVGAAYRDLHSNGRAQGASTLTMQLARNLFLSSEKTYGRKLQEVFLSVQIERRFTKQQIFELYANQIYLGHGTYGFEAGSEYFFNKKVHDLTLPEAALLAALPKGPEAYSPIKFPDRALKRRNLVLSEMLADGKITKRQEEAAEAAPLGLHLEPPANSVAPYFVEEVRKQLEKQFGVEEVHGAGLKVYTTLDLDLQQVANKAILDGTATYERRRGWKGRLPNVVLDGADIESYRHPDWVQPIDIGSYVHGVVTAVSAKRVTVKVGARLVVLTPQDWRWTQNTDGDSFLRTGDVVYVKVQSFAGDGTLNASLEQDSGAQASMMAVDNSTGEVLAMVGGRDFGLSQFNRATQAQRQVGSSFKPYVYTTAIEGGAKPTDFIVDGPTTFPTPNGPYTPHNYEGDYKGTMSLLNAFAESRNIPALKLADRYGIRKVIDTAHRFGVTSNIPVFLPVAIGSADITLAEQVSAYSVFPNDGIRIEPRYIRKVTQADGLPLDAAPSQVSEVISVDTARTMMQFLQAVVRYGTGASASQLKHPLGGKTGTTNDFTDAWFIGFSPSITCGTWIGFDDRESLGEKETGARAALPMWMDFMRAAIATKPDEAFPTTGAPKKKLDVPMSASTNVAKPVQPLVPKQEQSPEAPSLERSKPAAPASAAPVPAEEKPKMPEASRPAPQVLAIRVKPSVMSAKSTNERSGVSNPPPDIY